MGQDPLIDLPSGADKAAILDGLARVLDPELDESVRGAKAWAAPLIRRIAFAL
jgi:hypothetical protein